MSRVAVIGAGISGLTAAHYLKQAHHEVTVFEASERAGGALQTVRFGSELMEAGPDSLLASKPAAIELARKLGVELVPSCAEGTPGVVKNGRLLPLPDGFRLLAPTKLLPFALTRLLSLSGKLRAAAEVFVPPRKEPGDESVGDFVVRRFGPEILEVLAQPLIGGIYSADPSKLSLQATFPFLQSLEQKRGGVLVGMLKAAGRQNSSGESVFWAPRGGMAELVERLVTRLGGRGLRLSTPVSAVSREGRYWMVETAGRERGFDALILACPAHRASVLLKNLDPTLAEGLATVPYTSTATVNLVYDEKQIAAPLQGSGFVVPHAEGLNITACTYAHRKYPGRAAPGRALLRVHLGGELNQGVLRRENLVQTAVESLEPLLGLSGRPRTSQVTLHHKVIPQYSVGHLRLRRRLEVLVSRHSNLELAGNGLHGVGLSDCVKQATECARRLHGSV